MLANNTNIAFNNVNSCVRVKSKAVKFRFSGLNTNLRTQGESGLNGFFAFNFRARYAQLIAHGVGRISENTLCFMNHGTAALCKGLLKTGKWLTLASGSRYERLIIELHRSANNSMPVGYMVKRKGRSTFTWFMHPQKKGIYEIH